MQYIVSLRGDFIMKAREKNAPHETSPSSLLSGWARQGVQSFVAAQKILMDLAAQENALLIGMMREGLSKPGARLGASVAGLAEKGVENLAAAGKILLDLAADETAIAVDGLKEGLQLPAAAGTLAEVTRHRVDTLVEMQKNLLDATAGQAHALANTLREEGKVQPVAHLAELARRGIAGFIESEKKFLDLASQEVTAATKGDKRTHKPPRDRIEVLTKVAREGAEKYIDSQKKLFELAVEQLETTRKAGREHYKAARKEMSPSFGELTEKSVKNFVTAEKSLLDLAMKPLRGRTAEDGRKARRRPSTRTAKKQSGTAKPVVSQA
jgi:hypothetical protein